MSESTSAEIAADEHAPGTIHEKLEGWVPALAGEAEICAALEKAFDYRGDVTLTLKSDEKIEGYIFDRHTDASSGGSSLAKSFVRLLSKAGDDRRKVFYADIARLEFTGRDTAAGKSFETWVRKYNEKKAAGETNIRIDPEKLD